jgi:hypothetical protein
MLRFDEFTTDRNRFYNRDPPDQHGTWEMFQERYPLSRGIFPSYCMECFTHPAFHMIPTVDISRAIAINLASRIIMLFDEIRAQSLK